MTLFSTEGWVGVIRSCYPLGALPGLNESNGCHKWFNPDLNFSALYCFCDTDYCNAASTIVGGGPTTDLLSRLLYGVALLVAFLLPSSSFSSFWDSPDLLDTVFETRARPPAQCLAMTRSSRQGRWRQKAACQQAGREVEGVTVRMEGSNKSPDSSASQGGSNNCRDQKESVSALKRQNGFDRFASRFVVTTAKKRPESAMSTSASSYLGATAVVAAPFRGERGRVVEQTTFLRQYKHLVAFARFFKLDTGSASGFHRDMHRNVAGNICAAKVVGKEEGGNFKEENPF